MEPPPAAARPMSPLLPVTEVRVPGEFAAPRHRKPRGDLRDRDRAAGPGRGPCGRRCVRQGRDRAGEGLHLPGLKARGGQQRGCPGKVVLELPSAQSGSGSGSGSGAVGVCRVRVPFGAHPLPRPPCGPLPLVLVMTLNTQPGSKSPLRRRASTPLPRPGGSGATSRGEPCHPQLGHSASEPGARTPRSSCSRDSSGSPSLRNPRYRVVLLGDPGVGKTSLVNLFAGVQERDLLDQHGGGCLGGESAAGASRGPMTGQTHVRGGEEPGPGCLGSAALTAFSWCPQGPRTSAG